MSLTPKPQLGSESRRMKFWLPSPHHKSSPSRPQTRHFRLAHTSNKKKTNNSKQSQRRVLKSNPIARTCSMEEYDLRRKLSIEKKTQSFSASPISFMKARVVHLQGPAPLRRLGGPLCPAPKAFALNFSLKPNTRHCIWSPSGKPEGPEDVHRVSDVGTEPQP